MARRRQGIAPGGLRGVVTLPQTFKPGSFRLVGEISAWRSSPHVSCPVLCDELLTHISEV